jgi:hypothetical protein
MQKEHRREKKRKRLEKKAIASGRVKGGDQEKKIKAKA